MTATKGLFVTARLSGGSKETGNKYERYKAAGRVTKTDALDAQDIAHFGETPKPRLTEMKPEKLIQISDLLAVRSQCLEIITLQKNRLNRMPGSVHAPIKRILQSVQKEIAQLDEKLDQLFDQVQD